jgi:hypothetical protein
VVVILHLQNRVGLLRAARRAILDLRTLPLSAPIEPEMNLVALAASGEHIGCSNAPGQSYIWQTSDMTSFETQPRIVIDVGAAVSGDS